MSIAFTLLACVGLTFILKYATILSWPRNLLSKLSFFNDLFKCSLCLGFWSGVILAIASYFINWSSILYLLPLASSALSWISDSLLRVVQTIEISLDKHIEKQ
jgi:hypothetical protein